MGQGSLAQALKAPGLRFRGIFLNVSYIQREHKVRIRLITAKSQAVTWKSLTDFSSPCLEEGSMTRWMELRANDLQQGEMDGCNGICQINRPG